MLNTQFKKKKYYIFNFLSLTLKTQVNISLNLRVNILHSYTYFNDYLLLSLSTCMKNVLFYTA